MIFLFLFLTNICYSEKIIGGSINYENEYSDASEYVRGVICLFNSIIDDINSDIKPKAKFYDNNDRSFLDIVNTRKLIFSDKVDVLLGYTNLEGLKQSLKIAEEKNILVAFPNMSLSREEMNSLEGVIFLRPSIEEELDKIVEFVDGEVGIVYNNDSLWQKEYIESKLKVHAVSSENINDAILFFKRSSVKTVIFLGSKVEAVEFIKKANFTTLNEGKIILPFYLDSSKLKNSIQEYKIKVFICSIFKKNQELEDDYARYSKRYRPDFKTGPSGLEGFITAAALIEFLVESKIDRAKYLDIRIENYN